MLLDTILSKAVLATTVNSKPFLNPMSHLIERRKKKKKIFGHFVGTIYQLLVELTKTVKGLK